MNNSTAKTTIELAEYLADLVCNDPRLMPWWKDGLLNVTNGQIAFIFNCPEPPIESKWAWWDGTTWLNKENPLLFNPPNVEQCIKPGEPVALEFPDFPAFDVWENPFRETTSTCSECNGTGKATCNYNHKHQCPECNGDGKIPSIALDAYYEQVKGDERYIEVAEYGFFDKRYLWIVQQLASHRMVTYSFRPAVGNASVMTFTFEDGKGCLMGVANR